MFTNATLRNVSILQNGSFGSKVVVHNSTCHHQSHRQDIAKDVVKLSWQDAFGFLGLKSNKKFDLMAKTMRKLNLPVSPYLERENRSHYKAMQNCVEVREISGKRTSKSEPLGPLYNDC